MEKIRTVRELAKSISGTNWRLVINDILYAKGIIPNEYLDLPFIEVDIDDYYEQISIIA